MIFDNIKEKEQPRNLKRYFRMLLIYFAVIFAVIAVDQITKMLAVKHLQPIRDFPLIDGVLHLTYAENKGAAFSILADKRWVFMLTSSIAIFALFFFLVWFSGRIKVLLGVSLAFICGGGIGNMIDRINPGYVVDFINFELIDFAIFNGADTFICIGAALMVLYMILYEFKTTDKKDASKKSEN